jgi:hypothetical protein
VGIDPAHLGLSPLVVTGTAVVHDGAQEVVTVAATVTWSPTQRFAGYRPSSTAGAGSWMWILVDRGS